MSFSPESPFKTLNGLAVIIIITQEKILSENYIEVKIDFAMLKTIDSHI